MMRPISEATAMPQTLGGTLNSIDLATGEIVWQVPFGNFPSQPEPGFGAEYFAFSLP